MDADTILRIRPALTRYLKEFDDCFGRVTTRRHLDTYVEGQRSDLERKRAQAISRRLLVTQQPSCSATQRPRRPQPPATNPATSARNRRVLEGRDHLSTKTLVA